MTIESEPRKTAPAPEGSRPVSDAEQIADSVQIIGHSFEWLNDSAQHLLEQLRRDLSKEEDPPWLERLGEGLLEIALGAGAAGAGEFIADKLAHGFESAGHEFVKAMFEEGIGAGVAAGRAKLRPGRPTDTLDVFINSQQHGIRGTHLANQTKFFKDGRHHITTVEQGKQLADVCSEREMDAAAVHHYEATRDAWVSYLAQASFGAIGRHGPVQVGDVNIGPTTTNMSTQQSRDRTNAGVPGFVPAAAPSFPTTLQHDSASGVLEVLADLPEIEANQMDGSPEVKVAFLHGVNDTIREQYEGKPLASMRIPRQVVARVKGPRANFTINLDEHGTPSALTTAQGAWLRARSLVDTSANAAKDEQGMQEAGLALLLEELRPERIR